ncbi:MAG: hypothetical protein NWQ38_13130 [Cellulophaga sp.]|nr:hypothetical protein [Cellulophaga sp.]
MKAIRYLIIFSICFKINAQIVQKEIISIAVNGEKELLIPAYESDTIILTIELHNSKRAKKNSLLVYEYPSNLKIKENFTKKLETQLIASKNSIYKLVLKNDNKKNTDYSVIYTINSSKKKKPQIGFAIQNDTTYGPEIMQLAPQKILVTETIQNEKFYINSTSNALLKGGKNRIIIPVNIPENTKEWYYVFTASREEKDIHNTLSSFNLASQITKFIKDDTSIQNAVSNLSPPPGAHICDIYVIHKDTDAELFKEKEDFTSSLEGTRENFKSGIVKVTNTEKSFLGIRNPDNLYGIHVAVEIIAVVEKTEQVNKKVRKPIITSTKIPYFID